MMKLGNLLTAMVTPFTKEGEVDFARTRELVNRLAEAGSDGFVVCGTTGESATLSKEEKLDLFRCVIEAVGDRCAVIGGTGTNNTQQSIELTRAASELDLDAVMLVGPYYNKPSQEGLYRHFLACAEATPLPVIIYNVPGRTGKNIDVDTIVRLAEVSNIIGLKEASGDMKQISEICRRTPEDFLVYSGDDFVTLPMMALGAVGVISVVSNVACRPVADMVKAFHEGDIARAAQLHHELFPLYEACFLESGNPACAKRALEIIGFPVGGVRLPLVEASEKDTQKIREVCERMGLVRA
ncbi:MAG: 4-hydroxy-tetrahydrodipicolinate synthase [Candidatus Zipacnadales bacterium]